jgi:hypothetical protein
MITLFRMSKRGAADDVVAGVLLALMLLTMLAPGGLFLFPPPWNTVYLVGQIIVWIVTLGFLIARAGAPRHIGASVDQC